ncbi:MAG: hypothetical protein QOD99_1178 [Chthoniobacter sp.]|nr:hypothetical protein [Chthoniobacter sp.]
MRKNTEEFGAFSTSVAVAVSKPPANGAAFVSQSVPTGMIAGQSYNVSVSMRNIGTNTWTPGSGYKLGSQNPADNKRWGINRALLSSPVAQGETGTFTFNVVAPATSGNYDFQWRMLQEGISWFGAPTTDLLVPVNVLGDAAAFVSQQVPSTIYAGRTYQVSMTMKNVGSNAWSTVGKYRLGSQNPQDNKVWGVSRADFPTTVAPGDTVTIAFNVTAPAVAGTYNFQWRLVHESVVWFGDLSKNLQLNVAVPPNASSFVQQTVPSNMTAGQTYNVSVTMKNTGTATWTADKLYRLASENPRDNLIWG